MNRLENFESFDVYMSNFENEKNISRSLMYRKCRSPVISNCNDDGTAFTRTIVTRSMSTLCGCISHQFEALPITQIRPNTVWCTFCIYQPHVHN